MTIIEAIRFCKDTGRSVRRLGSMSVKWVPNFEYSFTADELLAEDWEVMGGLAASGKEQGVLKGVTSLELKALREAANLALLVGSDRWELQTSNSFRRIGTARGDGNVLCGAVQWCDAHPDLMAASGVLDYIIAAQPSVMIELLEDLEVATISFQQMSVLYNQHLEFKRKFAKSSKLLVAGLGALAAAFARDAEMKLSGDGGDPHAEVRRVLPALRSALHEALAVCNADLAGVKPCKP